MLACHKALASCISDHGAVIATELQSGKIDLATFLVSHDFQLLTHQTVSADAAGGDQSFESGLLQCAPGFDDQCVYDGLLKSRRYICPVLGGTLCGL